MVRSKAAEHRRTPKRGRHSDTVISLAFWSAVVLHRFSMQQNKPGTFVTVFPCTKRLAKSSTSNRLERVDLESSAGKAATCPEGTLDIRSPRRLQTTGAARTSIQAPGRGRR